MSEAHSSPEGHENESTSATRKWLEKSKNKVKRWIGHGVRFVGDEFAIIWGTTLVTTGAIASVLTANPLPLVVSAVGGALSAGGSANEWDSMKNSKSKEEKRIFKLAKVAQTIGVPAAGVAATLGNPIAAPIVTGMYLGGVAMGAKSMPHRK